MEGLSSICGGLGIIEEDDDGNPIGYSKGEYCLDNLKDLLRFLRRDDPEKREVFKQVCKWNVAGKDLIPIIEHCQEDSNLVLNAVKTLVFLTMPIEPASNDIPQQIEYLWGLKAAVTLSNAVPVIVSLLETPLENLENESFTEDDWKLVQLVLTFFRNTLAIQDISTQQKVGGSATQFLSLRDRFLEMLFQENVMDLILVLSQHAGGPHGYLRQDNLLLLETFFYIFKGQEPELIAKINLKGTKVDKVAETSVDGLRYIMEEEREKRKLTRLCNLNCYSQFSGTFTRLTLDGSKALFKGNPCSSSADALLKANKNPRGPSKRTMWDHGELSAANNEILKLLYDFISQFLTGGYNVLMQSMREDIEKDLQEIENGDVIIFFQVARFVTSFQYHKFLTLRPTIDVDNEELATPHDGSTLFKGNICGPIAETLNESMFQLVISKWRYTFDGLKVTNDYKFLSAAGSLMKTLIRMLDLVINQSPEDAQELQMARILLYKLFYDQTEEGMTQFVLNLIKSFDTHKQSKSDLGNLVETIHVVLRLIENLQARGTLRVSKKSRKRRMKTAMNSKNDNACEPSIDNSTAQNEVGSSTCEESADANVPKMGKLINHGCDGEETRKPDQDAEPVPLGSKPLNLGSNESEMEGTNRNDTNDGFHLGTEDSSGDEQPALTDEVDFKVSSLISAFANNTIIRNLCWLLKFYKTNSISTNHYIISMLRRICDDLELSPMLYQLSFLTIFYDILDEQKSRPGKEYENVVTFLKTLIRRMLRKMKSYPFLFIEVLFWKTRKECHYINCGTMLDELNGLRNENGKGRNVAPNGENGFFEGQRWVRRSIADALGDDDFAILSHDSKVDEDPYEAKLQKATNLEEGKECTKSIVDNGIDGRGNVDGVENSVDKEPERLSKIQKPLVLNIDLEGKIKDLYEKYKDSQHCCHLIAGELNPSGAISQIRVSKTLKQLGLKVPPKKKMQRSGASDQLRDNDSNLQNGETQPNLTVLEEGLSLRKHLHSRKRVRAFSEDQEQKIKDLFEQFKDQKRSSYMIASALDSTGTISAAKVSRKLKQLGLIVPKRKRSDTNLHLREEGYISSEGAGSSDDETLLSMKIRGKHEGIDYGERQNQKIASISSEDVPDDELLTSILAKTRKMLPKSYDDSANRDTEVSETDEFARSNQMETEEIDTMMPNHSSDSEPHVISLKRSDANMSIEKNDILHDPNLDELADSDADPDTTRENAPSRRRLRMVIDFEDEE